MTGIASKFSKLITGNSVYFDFSTVGLKKVFPNWKNHVVKRKVASSLKGDILFLLTYTKGEGMFYLHI